MIFVMAGALPARGDNSPCTHKLRFLAPDLPVLCCPICFHYIASNRLFWRRKAEHTSNQESVPACSNTEQPNFFAKLG